MEKSLDHKRIAQRLFDEFNIQEFGFAQVRRHLMMMGVKHDDIQKISDEIKKLVK